MLELVIFKFGIIFKLGITLDLDGFKYVLPLRQVLAICLIPLLVLELCYGLRH